MAVRYKHGATIRELVTEHGFHRETVSLALKRAGVTIRANQARHIDLERVDQLTAAGKTLTEIAAELGMGEPP